VSISKQINRRKKMTKRLGVLGVLLLVLCGALSMTAQQVATVGVGDSASIAKGSSQSSSATVGLYNMVDATFRHCAKYAALGLGEDENGKLRPGQKACNDDPSTVFATKKNHNLTTNAGKDFIKAQISGTGTTANCIYMAVGTSAVTPAAGDTTLTGESTANGMNNGGSTRWTGTYASTGTGTFTLTKVFTATGAVSSVQAAAVFTAASSGTMCFEVGSLGPVTLANTDTLTVTWSGTISKMFKDFLQYVVPLYAEPVAA
jgi:hypothetical protein